MKSCLVILVIAILALACNGHDDGGIFIPPVDPDCAGTSNDGAVAQSNRQVWGLWQFEADPVAGTLEVIPLRTGMMHLNALPMMEPPAGVNLSVSNLAFDGMICDIDVTLTHPFSGLTNCMGFDVCGILIGSGTKSDFSDPDIVMPGPGETRLMNADGYTRWWNPVEFSEPGPGIYRYKDGLLGIKDESANFSNTLNGYKVFCDDLDPNDNVLSLMPTDLNVFSDGAANTRHYTIDFSGGLVFNYAVDANWVKPTGEPPYEPEDFPVQGLRCEAWAVDVHLMNNTLWNDGVDSGGDLSVGITVFDHYNAFSDTLWIESPGNFPPTEGVYTGFSGDGYKSFDVVITDATPSANSIDLLIGVESEIGGYQSVLPDDTVTGYFLYAVDVGPGASEGDKYVDGDYAGGDSDGSQAKPFTTVQNGMAAVTSGYTVHVDYLDGGDNTYYTDGLILKSGVTFIGDNWNGGGPGKPKLKTGSAAYTIETTSDISDFTLEGFEIDFGQDDWSCGGVLIGGDNNSNITVRHNKFSGTIDDTGKDDEWHFSSLHMANCDNSLVEFNDFGPITFNGDPEAPFMSNNYVGPYVYDSAGIRVKNNFIHDISVNYTGGAEFSRVAVYGIWGSSCNPAYIHNNLVSHISGANDNEYGIAGININDNDENEVEYSIFNNTIDNMYYSYSGGYPPLYAIKLLLWDKGGESKINNTMATNLNSPDGVSVEAYYGSESGLYEITYSTCYNLDEAINYFFGLIVGDGAVDYPGIDPLYVNDTTSPYDYNFQSGSGCEMGDPNFLDWDDTGAASGNPDEPDCENRSRMGCFGGPDGDWDPYDL